MMEHKQEHESPDLSWIAFQYVQGELSPDDALAFESVLSEEQAAREAVASIVELNLAIRGAEVELLLEELQPSPWQAANSPATLVCDIGLENSNSRVAGLHDGVDVIAPLASASFGRRNAGWIGVAAACLALIAVWWGVPRGEHPVGSDAIAQLVSVDEHADGFDSDSLPDGLAIAWAQAAQGFEYPLQSQDSLREEARDDRDPMDDGDEPLVLLALADDTESLETLAPSWMLAAIEASRQEN